MDRADRTATGCGAGGDDGGGRDPADPGFFDDADESGARVLVLFERAANRQHVADCLRPTYDVITGESLDALDDTVDCCLVDAAAFARHHERLAADGERDPSAPPLLLVVDPDVLDSSGDRVWRRVDEVVTTPVSKAELLARVDALVERHSLVRRVARSEARFKSLFEAVPDPLFVVDGDGRVVAANAAFCDATGVVRADCLGDALRASDAFPEAAAARLEAAVADAPTRTPEQVSYLSPDGSVRFADASVDRLTVDEPPHQYVVVLRDVTERVHRTRELQRQNDRLEEFAGVLAHELRNPLNIAEGRLGLARAGGPDAADDLRRVADAHGRIERMIDELLELSRQGEVIGDTATADFESFVRSTWAETPTGDATLVLEGDAASITGDLDRIADVFRNFFRNAVEHGSTGNRTAEQSDDAVEHGSTSPDLQARQDAVEHGSTGNRTAEQSDDAVEHGGSSITVTVGALPDESGFYVADDGPGIPENERDAVFDPGYTTAEAGTGFGLAIVDQITAAHDWDVAVVESADGGARFEVTGLAAASRDA